MPVSRHALELGHRLDEYVIVEILGSGGFGITYRAIDPSLQRHVAIKEYFPEQFADRHDDHTVAARLGDDHEEKFQWGLNRFLSEARTLAQFEHPNIVNVTRFFEANGTAYLVMKFEEGKDLQSWLQNRTEPPSESEILSIILPVLDGLEKVHALELVHRDIKPQNIMLRGDKTPVLIDFGSARAMSRSQNTALTALVSPGYSPPEQYGVDPSGQGPWTDIYAISGFMYRMIAGTKPPDAVQRMAGASMTPAQEIGLGRISAGVLAAIDRGLELKTLSRPQSVAEFRVLLAGKSMSSIPPTRQGADEPTIDRESQPKAPEPARMQIPKTWWIAGTVAILVLAFIWSQRDGDIGADAAIESVVITRFVNMSGAEYQFLVDGFAEQLISTLYQVPDLRILKGNLPAQDEGPREIASRYDADTVVSGSVQQLDGQFTIRTIVYAEDPADQCGQSVSGTTQEMFSLHEQVATKVRDCIVGVTEEAVSPPSRPAGSVSYLRYLRGKSFLARRDVSSMERAAELFLESIEIDPAYGSAYLALANTYVLLADYGAQNAMFDLAVATVEEGITRDPSILEPAQTYIGYVQTERGNWPAATESFEIATGSTTAYPPAQHYYSRLLAATGRIDDSLIAAQAAWEMDREDQVLNSRLAIAHLWKNEMEEARQFYDIANAIDVGAPVHLESYALFLIRDDRFDEAREVARRAMTLYQADASWVDPVFDELAESANSATTHAVLQEHAAQNVIPPAALVTFWVLAGQADRAMEMAWKLVDDPSVFDIELIYLDEFRILRQHEDFPRLLDELGLSDYWRSTGCQWDLDRGICVST